METWIELRARGGYVVRRTKVKKTILARSVPFFFFWTQRTLARNAGTHTLAKKKKRTEGWKERKLAVGATKAEQHVDEKEEGFEGCVCEEEEEGEGVMEWRERGGEKESDQER